MDGGWGILMGVRRQWKILKITQIEMDSSTRAKLIEAITRKKKTHLTLYAWDVHPIKKVAKEAFFTEQAAVKNWFIQKRLWEVQTPPSGVVLHKWVMSADDILSHIHDMKLCDVPTSLNAETSVGIVPSSLYEELQQSLKIQS